MKTSVIGYPRVGCLRELKFASEKYFRNEITANELKEISAELRKQHWTIQQENEIDFVSSNDFSFYDNLLDTANMLNIIPKRYVDLNLSDIDTYFAMARGYQGEKGDVKALAMKKWFNTNYHYMVPELEDDTCIKLNLSKAINEFVEARNLGIKTKPVITGAFTVLKLLRYTGTKSALDFVDSVVEAYADIIKNFDELGAEWIQFDEPCIVKDLTIDDINMFTQLYNSILNSKGNVKVLLQTYFGDIRDCYNDVTALAFDGIGLDFVEGKKSLSLVRESGFPKDKILFAGVVNGKNIWKNQYSKTYEIITELKKYCEEIVLSTSCSLLHVPYTLKNETKLADEYTKYFAFAEEKLCELKDLKKICSAKSSFETEEYVNNKKIFDSDRNCSNVNVKKRVGNIKNEYFTRKPEFSEREKIQHRELNLPLFPTTTIGSFPQTADVKANRSAYKNGSITEKEYIDFNKKKIAECVVLQDEIGIDVLVHGEFERNDMVEYFGEKLNGYLFTEKAWVQSYGTRCVKPPIIWGDISREKSMTVDWSVYAQSLTKKYVKGMLTGPVTILNWSFPREDISLKECAYQIALAIRDEVLDLEANGIKIIQVDEAALREKLPLRKSDWKKDYLDWAIPAFRLVHSGVKPETQIHTHMCYSEFTDIITAIDNMDADVITFEASRSDLQILDSLKENNFRTEVGPGVYDIHSPRIPSVEEIKEALYKMIEKIPAEKLWVNPDCGLKTRGNEETKPSLKNLVSSAIELRNSFSNID
jgi:5-methyltetrahydropteroyltriglutamate--homocysteine S-methyltransferase